MLAHRMNTEWLFCFQGPVAYAHRQRSVALRAKTKQPDLYGRSTTQTALRAVIPLTPPPPPPQPRPWWGGGAKRWEVFRRVGEAGFAAQPTIERGIGFQPVRLQERKGGTYGYLRSDVMKQVTSLNLDGQHKE